MRYAFSLVELSIVLVILGLLTGGILAGQSLIRAAELRTTITDVQRYTAAVMTFRDKYFGMPGDLTNAEAFWGTMATGTCPAATAGTGTQTCNGDGDGKIEALGAGVRYNEHYGAWQHLANAGLIEGNYSGLNNSTSGAYGTDVGSNIPASKLTAGSGWMLIYVGDRAASDSFYFEGDYGNALVLGNDIGDTGPPNGGVMKAEEAWGIDKKVDDRKPGYGALLGAENQSRTACSTSNALDVEYDLSNISGVSNQSCPLIIKTKF